MVDKSLNKPAYCWYQYDSLTYSEYGALYNYNSVKSMKTFIEGWRMPTHEEWSNLAVYVGENPGIKLKSREGWHEDGNGTDDYGFNALPAGYLQQDGLFPQPKTITYWWFYPPLKDYSEMFGYYDWNAMSIWHNGNFLGTSSPSLGDEMGRGFSIRLIKDQD